MCDGISYNEQQRRELLSFVQEIAALTITVELSKEDADKLVHVLFRARQLAQKEVERGLPF